MPIRKYANARPTGRDSEYSVSDNSANHSVYTETTSNKYNTVSDNSVSSDYSVTRETDFQDATSAKVSEMLVKMSPAYKAGKARRQADPLAWRIEKLLKRLRPMLSADAFMELTTEFSKSDPMEQAALAHRLTEWLKHAHGYGDS